MYSWSVERSLAGLPLVGVPFSETHFAVSDRVFLVGRTIIGR
jgi:hypothetical protein